MNTDRVPCYHCGAVDGIVEFTSNGPMLLHVGARHSPGRER